MVKQKQLFKPRFIKLQSVVPTRPIKKKRIQLKDLSRNKTHVLKDLLINKQNSSNVKTAAAFDGFVRSVDRFGNFLHYTKRMRKINRPKKYKNKNKRSKTLRELTAYHYHYKKVYRKRKYMLWSKLKSFWLKLIDNSQYYNEGKLLPFAASKLYNLSTHNDKDRKRIVNFDKNSYKVNISKYSVIKLQFNGNLSNAVHINLYFNPSLENNLQHYQWFSVIKDANGQRSILKIVNPHSSQTHYINTVRVSCVYLHLVNLAVVQGNEVLKLHRIISPVYTTTKFKKHHNQLKSQLERNQAFKLYEGKLRLWKHLVKANLLPNERAYLRFKKKRAAHFERKYGRKAKAAKAKAFAKGNKKRRNFKKKFPLISAKRMVRIKTRTVRRPFVDYDIKVTGAHKVTKYRNFAHKFYLKYNKGTHVKLRRRRKHKGKKKVFANPFIAKKYSKKLHKKRKLFKALIRNKVQKLSKLDAKIKLQTLRRTKLMANTNQSTAVVRSVQPIQKLFIGKTEIFHKRNKKSKKKSKLRKRERGKRAVKNMYIIPANVINLWNTHYINLHKNIISNRSNKAQNTHDDFIAGKFPLQRRSEPVFVEGKLSSVSTASMSAFNEFSNIVKRKLKSKKRLVKYNSKLHKKVRSVKLNTYADKLVRKAINKSIKTRTKLIKRAALSKLFKESCKLKGNRLIKVKSLAPSKREIRRYKKLNPLRRWSKMLVRFQKKHNYEVKLSHYIEFKSFRWKYYIKRWHSKISRWKRLAIFRRLMRTAWRNYRKLNKNFIFIKLFRANFSNIMGISETDLLDKWVKVRRGDNTNPTQSVVARFNQALQLKMDGLAMFLGLAPNRPLAQEFVKFGGMRINGMVVTNINHSMAVNDMLQIDPKVNRHIRALHKNKHWEAVRARIQFSRFLQTTWSLMLFMMVRYPYDYELLEESILNERWVRFFIRYFPVRIAKYKKAKVKWYKY